MYICLMYASEILPDFHLDAMPVKIRHIGQYMQEKQNIHRNLHRRYSYRDEVYYGVYEYWAP